MRRLLLALALVTLLSADRPGPALAAPDYFVFCIAVLPDDTTLATQVSPSENDFEWFIAAADFAFRYEGNFDSVKQKEGKFLVQDKHGIQYRVGEHGDFKTIKNAELKGFLGLDGRSFDLTLKDRTRHHTLHFSPSTSKSSGCDAGLAGQA
jgi:hypothetical protein